MNNSPTHPIMAGFLEACSAPAPPSAGTKEPEAAPSSDSLLTRGDRAYSHSRIIRARKDHDCARCDEIITIGTNYLRYQLSVEFSDALHLQCAQLRSENGSLVYDCRALRAHLGLPLRSAT